MDRGTKIKCIRHICLIYKICRSTDFLLKKERAGTRKEISGVHVQNKEELRGLRNLSFVATTL